MRFKTRDACAANIPVLKIADKPPFILREPQDERKTI
jgi:hypothetical protein